MSLGLNVRDIYPEIDSYEWWWHQPERGQRVKRYRHPSGTLIDVYTESGGTWAVTPAVLKEQL